MLVDIGNPNQVTGIVCFALASASCAYTGRQRASRAWRRIAWLQAAFCLEIVVNGRHRLHGIVDALLQDRGWYGGRTPWQLGLLALLAVLAAAFVPIAWRGMRGDRTAQLALAASLAVAVALAVEAVSLHAVDAWMYAEVGPLLSVVAGWVVASMIVIASALVAARR